MGLFRWSMIKGETAKNSRIGQIVAPLRISFRVPRVECPTLTDNPIPDARQRGRSEVFRQKTPHERNWVLPVRDPGAMSRPSSTGGTESQLHTNLAVSENPKLFVVASGGGLWDRLRLPFLFVFFFFLPPAGGTNVYTIRLCLLHRGRAPLFFCFLNHRCVVILFWGAKKKKRVRPTHQNWSIVKTT